jgi:hypothetical protein
MALIRTPPPAPLSELKIAGLDARLKQRYDSELLLTAASPILTVPELALGMCWVRVYEIGMYDLCLATMMPISRPRCTPKCMEEKQHIHCATCCRSLVKLPGDPLP